MAEGSAREHEPAGHRPRRSRLGIAPGAPARLRVVLSPYAFAVAVLPGVPGVIIAAAACHPRPRPTPSAWAGWAATGATLVWLTYRLLTARVTATPDWLYVRGVLRTRRLPWTHVVSATGDDVPRWVDAVAYQMRSMSWRGRLQLEGRRLHPLALYRYGTSPRTAALLAYINEHAAAEGAPRLRPRATPWPAAALIANPSTGRTRAHAQRARRRRDRGQ
jgi:hypothetical protein